MKRALIAFVLVSWAAFGQQTLGDYPEDATVHFLWTTVDSAGEPVTRATDGTVSVYKDNGTTQSTAGVTDTEDFDSLTGVHAVTIDLSADAFYATNANYVVTVNGAVVDGVTVNAPIAYFSIEAAYMRGTDSAFLASGAPANFGDLSITASTGRVDVASIEGTDATDTLGTAQTGDSFARLGAPAGASVSADVAAVKAETAAIENDTQDLQTQIGTAGAGLTDLGGMSAAMQAEVNAEADTALTDYGAYTDTPPTVGQIRTEIETAGGSVALILEDTATTIPGLLGALEDLDATEVEAAVNAALEALHLDHLLAVTYDPASKPGAADALWNEMVESDGGVSRLTANALEQGPSGGETKEDIAAEVESVLAAAHGSGAWTSSSTGVGGTLVDHNTGGVDALQVTEGDEVTGIGDVLIRAYLKSEYDVGTISLKGWTTTGDDGRWLAPLSLTTELDYYLLLEKAGVWGPVLVEVTVP